MFDQFGAHRGIDVSPGATLSLVRTIFEEIQLYPAPGQGSAVIRIRMRKDGGSAHVRLHGCTFSGIETLDGEAPSILVADNRGASTAEGVFYSDSGSPEVCVYTGSPFDRLRCESSAPKPLSEAPDSFLSSGSPFLVSTKQVRTCSVMLGVQSCLPPLVEGRFCECVVR